MGTPGSAMAGQAGVRALEHATNIWGINVPLEVDTTKSPEVLRKDSFLTRTEGRPATEKRWHTRFECSGGASVRAEGPGYPIHGQVKDIAQGGAYIETLTPITVNTEVFVKMNVEGVAIESPGVVRTSYPMVGMGISFQNMSPENQEKINSIIQSIRNRSTSPKNLTEPAFASGIPDSVSVGLQLDTYSVRELAMACRTLAADPDGWKASGSSADLEELRLALTELQQKLAPSPQMEFIDFFSTSVSQGGRA
jgi:PilZ domain